MQGKSATMKEAKEILRLSAQGMSDRRIAQIVDLARSTVARLKERARAAGLAWPLPEGLSDAALTSMLFERDTASSQRGARRRAEPDWAAIHLELKRPHVTLMLLWEEYRVKTDKPYGYSRFCELYNSFAERLSPSMRFAHAAGEKMFVDYAGATVPVVVDWLTGEARQAQIFVAVLGASNLTYAQATWTQSTGDWVHAHVEALSYFGGAPSLVVPDNLKAAIVKACRYDPGVNRTYSEFAAHYGMGVMAARVRKPKDKAKVEVAVQIVERWILARLRHARFSSIHDLNAAIRVLIDDLNDNRVMRKLKTTRRALFEAVERSALKPLPVDAYVFAEWKLRRVNLDYHVDIDGHYYSVPHRFVREKVEARVAARSVEIFHAGERIAVHMREGGVGRHTTQPDHMPEHHRHVAGWTIDAIRREAGRIGDACSALVARIFEERRHREQGIRACLGIVRLTRQYGAERVEAACARGLEVGSRTYGSIRSILDNNLDRCAQSTRGDSARAPIEHENLRGPRYYN